MRGGVGADAGAASYNYMSAAPVSRGPLALDWNLSRVSIADHHAALADAASIFKSAGFYAYRTLDDENRWCVACDLEEGHIDVRIGADGYELDVWATSPGMFLDEEDERRRHALERLARISLPGLRRGYLEDNQDLEWSQQEQGLALRASFALPFAAGPRLPDVAMEQLAELTRAMRFFERKLLD
jgi:hypothetical protein